MANMIKRGGGITDILLIDDSPQKNDYYTLHVEFETVDSMGANLINSCLEVMGIELIQLLKSNYAEENSEPELIMIVLLQLMLNV